MGLYQDRKVGYFIFGCIGFLLVAKAGCEVNSNGEESEWDGSMWIPEFCKCGKLIADDDVGVVELVRRVYPGTSDDVYDFLEESLLKCNHWIDGGVEKGVEIRLPCIFPEEQELRPDLEDPSQDCACGKQHKVLAGETLWSIATKELPELDPVLGAVMMLACNPRISPHKLEEGDSLHIYCLPGESILDVAVETSVQEPSLAHRKVLAKKKKKAYFVEEGCPICSLPKYTSSKSVANDNLLVCGCKNDCAKCAVNFVNGCSSPFKSIEPAFQDTVLPACFMHDACYSCGSHFFSKKKKKKEEQDIRKKCDELMKDRMRERCQYVYSDDEKFLHGCHVAALAYYSAARTFGSGSFREDCACPDSWRPYVDSLFIMDFCVDPVRESFSLAVEFGVDDK